MARGEDKTALLLDEYHGRSEHTSDSEESVDEKEYLPHPGTDPRRTRKRLADYLLLSPSLLRIALVSFLHSLMPSFFRRSDPAAKTKLHPTAYLDGVRGVAAFFVFIYHFLSDWFPALRYGYASGPEYYNILQFPIIRIFYQGRGMVTTFFIISGYVLSYKALRQMRAGQYSALLDSLASSTFRRGMRLFIPTTITTFIALLFAQQGWYRQDPLGHNLVPGRMGEEFYGQFMDWWRTTIGMSNPFGNVNIHSLFVQPYGSQLWTIPVEYRGSFVVFLTLLCLARVTNTVRIIILGGLISYTMWLVHWDLSLFIMGTFLADLGFAFAARAARSPDASLNQPDILDYISELIDCVSNLPRIPANRKSQLVSVSTKVTFFLGVFLLCYPDEQADKTPGYVTLVQITPKAYQDSGMHDKYWLAMGAFLLIASITSSPTLQKPFNMAFAQYLARISYALYLVHPLFLHTIGMKMLYGILEAPADWVAKGEEKWEPATWSYMYVFAQAVVINTALSIWFADWVWRMVDNKAVNFAHWVSEKVWIKE
jgi:peptidoglycan/LPS O-acetylase OafA/YrhL